jgi:hypothetical protein
VNYLLDTCVISEVVRKRPAPEAVSWLAAQDEDHLFISVLSLGDVHKGIALMIPGGDARSRPGWMATCGGDSPAGSSTWMPGSPRAGAGSPAPPNAPDG